MNREDFVRRWRARRDELARLGAHVEGAKLCDEVLADFEHVVAAILARPIARARLLIADDDAVATSRGTAELVEGRVDDDF